MALKERMTKLVNKLKEGLYERDEIISVVLLSALAEQNIFLYGPPGTAKSLISRRLSKAFQTKHYFEHLMQKFSTPEEVFGPISISELKKDNYLRKTKDFLPEAEFAFLDEIWKSSPAILNTLLTIINEKIFKNGSLIQEVPLKVLISASNETPPENQGLDALYDRFLTRLFVAPIEYRDNFEMILQNGTTQSNIEIEKNLVIKNEEWKVWKKEINNIKLSKDTLNIINGIRIEFEKLNKKEPIVYISDRRWQKAALLLKANAYFCDRDKTNIVDCLLLKHCLWATKENREKVFEIVEGVIKLNGFDTIISLTEIDKEKAQLEKEINEEFYYTKNTYKTDEQDIKIVEIKGVSHFKCTKHFNYNNNSYDSTFYIPITMFRTNTEYYPVDQNGNILKWITYNFKGSNVCNINVTDSLKGTLHYMGSCKIPESWSQKGKRKENIKERLIHLFLNDIEQLRQKIEETLQSVINKKKILIDEASSPFIPDDKSNIAVSSIDKQIEELQFRIKDCKRLKNLVN